MLPPKNGLNTFANEVDEDSDKGGTPAPKDSKDFEYDAKEGLNPILFFQERLHDLIRDLALLNKKQSCLRKDYKKTTCFMQMLQLPITESLTWTCRQYSEWMERRATVIILKVCLKIWEMIT